MAVSPRTHRFVRSLTHWYPFRIPAWGLNAMLSWIGFDGPTSQWMEASPRGRIPGLALDVANRYHRKNFYFLKAFWREALKTPLARYLEETLTPGGVCVDIGAHLGFYAFMASARVGPTGAVHAFEPDPFTLTSLTRSAQLNGGHVTVHGVALADAVGELTLHRAAAQAHSLVAPVGADPRFRGETTTVPVTTLDIWARQANLDGRPVQLVKVDVEGAEARTLAGGREFLRSAGLPPIWCEVRGPQGSTRAPGTFAAVVDVLAPLGYQPHRWSRTRCQPVTAADVIGREDILFRAPGAATLGR